MQLIDYLDEVRHHELDSKNGILREASNLYGYLTDDDIIDWSDIFSLSEEGMEDEEIESDKIIARLHTYDEVKLLEARLVMFNQIIEHADMYRSKLTNEQIMKAAYIEFVDFEGIRGLVVVFGPMRTFQGDFYKER